MERLRRAGQPLRPRGLWSGCDGPLTVAGVGPALANYEFFYNYKRPHTALDCQTPNQYLVKLEAA